MDCSPPGSSVHVISQERILEWVAISFSRGSFGNHEVTHATTHLGTHDKTAMTGKDRTTVDNHILTGLTTPATIGILAALDADAIITRIETGIDDEGILTRLKVESITILGKGRVAREYIIYNNILTH